ncbi:hypothetical protein AQ1_00885 [alpha proteobacterium Q-1]|nr:hypothetical protein AQ1_00885 [alpha proteobacterium Q-1]
MADPHFHVCIFMDDAKQIDDMSTARQHKMRLSAVIGLLSMLLSILVAPSAYAFCSMESGMHSVDMATDSTASQGLPDCTAAAQSCDMSATDCAQHCAQALTGITPLSPQQADHPIPQSIAHHSGFHLIGMTMATMLRPPRTA